MPTLTDAMTGSLSNADWVSAPEKPDPTPLPHLPGWKLLVRPVPVRVQSKGGVWLPDNARSDMEYLNTVGRVLAVGDLAYRFEENRRDLSGFAGDPDVSTLTEYPRWCQVGDYVAYGKYTGQKVTYQGVRCVLIRDRDVEFVVPDPSWLDPHA